METLGTERLALHAVMPAELLSFREIELPSVVPRQMVQPYRKRLKLLKQAEEVQDLLSDSAYDRQFGVPDERGTC